MTELKTKAELNELYDDLFQKLVGEDGYSELGYSLKSTTYYDADTGDYIPLTEEETALLAQVEYITSESSGDGKPMYEVFRYTPTGQFFGYSGYYSSWDSNTWDDDGLSLLEAYTVVQYRVAR